MALQGRHCLIKISDISEKFHSNNGEFFLNSKRKHSFLLKIRNHSGKLHHDLIDKKEKERSNASISTTPKKQNKPNAFNNKNKMEFDNLDRELTQKLSQNQNVFSLLKTIESNQAQMKAVHVCVAFHRIAKCSTSKKNEFIRDLSRTHSTAKWVSTELNHVLPLLSPQGLANTAWAYAQLGHGSEDLMAHLIKNCLRKLKHFRPLEVSILISSLAKMNYSNPEFVEVVIQTHVIPCIDAFRPRQIKEIAWSLVKLERPSPGIFHEIALNVAKNIHFFENRQLASMAWSFSKGGYNEPIFFESMSKQVLLSLHTLSPLDISNIAWACTKQNFVSKELMNGLSLQSSQIINSFCSQSLSNTLWAFACQNHIDRPFMEKASQFTVSSLNTLSPESIAIILWSFASLRYYSPSLLKACSHSLLTRLSSFPSHSLASVAFSFATFAFTSPLFQSISEEVLKRINSENNNDNVNDTKNIDENDNVNENDSDIHMKHDVSRQSLVTIAWSMAVQGHFCPFLFPALHAHLLKTPEFTSNELCQIYQVELALELESPSLGVIVPSITQSSSPSSFFQFLWLSGHVKQKAQACWKFSMSATRQVSSFQEDISASLTQMGLHHLKEYEEGGFSLDIALVWPNLVHKIAIEADGPSHFAHEPSHRCLGPTLLKARLLRRLGWFVIQIPFFEWEKLESDSSREEYLTNHLITAVTSLNIPTLSDAESEPNSWKKLRGNFLSHLQKSLDPSTPLKSSIMKESNDRVEENEALILKSNQDEDEAVRVQNQTNGEQGQGGGDDDLKQKVDETVEIENQMNQEQFGGDDQGGGDEEDLNGNDLQSNSKSASSVKSIEDDDKKVKQVDTLKQDFVRRDFLKSVVRKNQKQPAAKKYSVLKEVALRQRSRKDNSDPDASD